MMQVIIVYVYMFKSFGESGIDREFKMIYRYFVLNPQDVKKKRMCQKNRRKKNEERLRTDCYTQGTHRVDKKSGKKQ